MKKRKALALFTLALVAVVAVGCGATRPSQYYQLTIPAQQPSPHADPFPITLLVGRLTAPDLYREDQIVYSSRGESMGTYEYHRWAEPPTEMIQEITLRQLRESGRFRAVDLHRSNMRGDYLLHGHLFDFKEVSGNSVVGRVTMEMELSNINGGTTVWSHFYSHDEPAEGKDVSAIVAALDKNVQQGITEMRTSLEQYFTAHPPSQAAP